MERLASGPFASSTWRTRRGSIDDFGEPRTWEGYGVAQGLWLRGVVISVDRQVVLDADHAVPSGEVKIRPRRLTTEGGPARHGAAQHPVVALVDRDDDRIAGYRTIEFEGRPHALRDFGIGGNPSPVFEHAPEAGDAARGQRLKALLRSVGALSQSFTALRLL